MSRETKNAKLLEMLERTKDRATDISIQDFLHTNALEYAHYTLQDRALILEDGLKPVNRRILYAMHQMGLKKDGKRTKGARIVGETMGKYHPHGDSSIEAALARTGQDFSLRVPLIDVQGVVGKIQGSKPAAGRYWEACFSPAGWELVKDLDQNVVPMKPTEDNESTEPVILPVAWPVGIINGTQGIAVGYASNIPAHNPTEIMNSCIEYIKGNVNNIKDVMRIIKGPDFPTGGELIGLDGVKEYLETGSGSFVVRGKYTIESLPRGKHKITFSELPYQVTPEQVITAVSKQQSKGSLKTISSVEDHSDKDNGLEVVINVKAGANPMLVLEQLWKLTPVQSRFSVNATVFANGKPTSNTSMLQLIEQFINVKKAYTRTKLENKKNKLDLEHLRLSGISAVLVNINKAIKIIRDSDTVDDARIGLVKNFKIEEKQADYILRMPLRSLTKADKDDILFKQKDIESKIKALEKLLKNEDDFNEYVISELEETKKIISDKRRTVITKITEEELKEVEKQQKQQEKLNSKDSKCYVNIFVDNKYSKSLNAEIGFKQPFKEQIVTTTLSSLVVVTADGTGSKVAVNNLMFDNLFDNKQFDISGHNSNKVVGIAKTEIDKKDVGLLTVTNKGNVSITQSKYSATFKDNTVVKLDSDEHIVYAKWITQKEYDKQELLIVNKNGLGTKFALSTIRPTGVGTGTIKGMNTDVDVVNANVVDDEYTLVTTTKTSIKSTSVKDIPIRGRGTKGVYIHKPKAKEIITTSYAGKKLVAISPMGVEIKLPKVTALTKAGDKFTGAITIGEQE